MCERGRERRDARRARALHRCHSDRPSTHARAPLVRICMHADARSLRYTQFSICDLCPSSSLIKNTRAPLLSPSLLARARQVMNGPPPSPALLLERVTLTNFKAYAGEVHAGPFDARCTSIVGPNGAGKSCLIDGVAFALGAQQEKTSLARLVNHAAASADRPGALGVAVHFRSADDAAPLRATSRPPRPRAAQCRMVVPSVLVHGRRRRRA